MCWNGNRALKAGYSHNFYGPALDLHQSQKPTNTTASRLCVTLNTARIW